VYSCREVGGDWFNHIPLPDGRTAIVLQMFPVKEQVLLCLWHQHRSVLRMFAERGLSPGEVLTG
jgi:hypothetical protein